MLHGPYRNSVSEQAYTSVQNPGLIPDVLCFTFARDADGLATNDPNSQGGWSIKVRTSRQIGVRDPRRKSRERSVALRTVAVELQDNVNVPRA